MAPNYLSSGARERAVMLGMMSSLAEDILARDRSSKEEATCLKYLVTYSKKWLNLLGDRLDLKDLGRMIRQYKDSNITLVPKVTRQKKRLPSETAVLNALEMLIEQCCKGCEVDETKCCGCYLFNANMELGVGAEYKNNGYCPFRYEKKEEKQKGEI